MQYLLTPYAKLIPPFAWWDGAFSEQELDRLQANAKTSGEKAQVGGGANGIVDSHIRRSNVSWMDNNPNTKWVFERLAHIASQLNMENFEFDLTGFGETLQLTNYDHSERGMYGWHQDYGGKVSRKLSLVVQLTDPTNYEGGDLQIMTSGNPVNVKKQRGLVAVFPSYVLHQVTPITKGSRQSLVAWVSGPAFK